MTQNTDADAQLMDGNDFPLGAVLRGERATMGKSLDDVQNEIRIKSTFIDAIENLDPSVFETPGFVSGYVRSYARYLNLDADMVFARFCEEANFEPPVRLENTSKRTAQQKEGLAGAAFAGHSNLERERWWERISPAGLASIAGLFVIVAGLSYGGYSVLQQVQRVTIAPSPIAPEIVDAGPSLDLSEEAIAVANSETTATPASGDGPLVDLYRPQLLDVPILVPRDGPIALIKPGEGPDALPSDPDITSPQVTELVVTGVEIFAAQPAWISVTSPTLGTIFEQILEENSRYRVPVDVQDAVLRAGNAGSVYLIVNGTAFGPVGDSARVAKDVVLEAVAINDVYNSVDSPQGYDPAATPVNLAQSN